MSNHFRSELGLTFTPEGVHFAVWAPFAEHVALTGSFTDWLDERRIPLERGENGVWSTTVADAKAGQEYKFVITYQGETFERNDPRALQVTAAGDASVIIDPNFDWGGDDFTPTPREQKVIYELHIGTFYREDPATPGTFAMATEKLDYLRDLGVTDIEVLPVNGTNMERWWGYEPTYLFAVDAAYGGRRAFLEFVRAAHERGMGVIVDVVYNHLSPQAGLDLWRFDGWHENDRGGIYFYNDWRGDTPWGPRPDFGRAEVREFLSDNMVMWLQDCHVDGIRADAVFQIRNTSGHDHDEATDLPDGWKFLREATTAARAAKPEALLIGEDMAINAKITQPAKQGGAGFDTQWESRLPTDLRKVLNGDDDAERDLAPLWEEFNHIYNGDPFQRVIFSESHDADANGHARMNEEITPGEADSHYAALRSALAAAMIMTIPGIPMLFQGQEFLESGWFSHWRALDWDKAKINHGMVQLYRDLIKLRRELRGLQAPEIKQLLLDNKNKVLAYVRGDVVVVLNISNQELKMHEVPFPESGTWTTRFNSVWNGYHPDFANTPTPDVEVTDKTGGVNLGPYAAVILTRVS